ncbi:MULTISPECIES: ABC transporter substrate-binding protein [unclassified Streptomyces]|uniref:ABC transporter substrate-binding protein n=1 Tax=unclassified Streptomyces TaxID=2593676 RepID=UPI003D9480B2
MLSRRLSRHARTRCIRVLASVVAVASVSLLSGCGGDSSAAAGSKDATLQLGWIANVENMGPYTALDSGYFKDKKVNVAVAPGGPSVTVEPLVVSGKALVGLTSADIAAKAIIAGAPIKIVAATLQTNPTSVMSLAKAPVNTLKDLEGKRLCIQTSGLETMKTVLKANKIDLAKVKFVTADFDPSPLVTGQCDAFTSFLNNQPITLASQGVKTKVFPLSDYGYNVVADALVVSDKTLADPTKRATVVKIISALAQGWRKALDNTDAATQLVVDKYGKNQHLDLTQQKLGAKTYLDLVQSDETKRNGLLSISDATVKANIATLNLLGIRITADQLFDTSLIADAKPVD